MDQVKTIGIIGVGLMGGGIARNLLWGPDVLWAGGSSPTISVADDDIDLIQLMYDGTNFFGLYNQAFV